MNLTRRTLFKCFGFGVIVSPVIKKPPPPPTRFDQIHRKEKFMKEFEDWERYIEQLSADINQAIDKTRHLN